MTTGGDGTASGSKAQAVVIGAGGGIGHALLTQLRSDDRFSSVTGFSRREEPALDVLSEESIAAAADRIASGDGPLRLVIVASGFLHGDDQMPEKSIRDLDRTALVNSMAVNAIGPALVMKHFLPLFPKEGRAVFAALSARVGSIEDNRLGGWYGYRASKAALNQFVRTGAVELKRRCREAVCVTVHPGTVDTRLSQPFAKKGLKVRAPEEAATDILDVLNRLGPGDSGGFFAWDGQRIPF